MRKLILLVAVAFALAVGTVTVLTIQPQSAVADGGGCVGSNC